MHTITFSQSRVIRLLTMELFLLYWRYLNFVALAMVLALYTIKLGLDSY